MNTFGKHSPTSKKMKIVISNLKMVSGSIIPMEFGRKYIKFNGSIIPIEFVVSE
jgi:hypothetical protein